MSPVILPLGEICTIQGGGTPSRKQPEFYGGDIPWLTVKDLKSHNIVGAQETITDAGVNNSATRMLPPNTVVVATRISVGAVGIARVPVAINQDLKGLIVDPRVSPDYLAWFLRARRSVLEAKASGSTVKGITNSVLASLSIPVPSIVEQRRIVDLLERAAEIRRRTEAADAKARTIIRALFLDTFGDPATNPKGWQRIALGEAILEGPQNGLYRPASDYGGGVRILRIDSFDGGSIVPQDELKRLRIDAGTAEKFGLRQNDIVINRVNSPSHLGKSALIPELTEPVVFESNMMRLRVDPNLLLPQVVASMLQLDSVRRGLIKNAKHAINQSSVNQGDVKGVEIFAPPLPLQASFVEQVGRIRTIALSLDSAAVKTEVMATSLSAEIFDGSPT